MAGALGRPHGPDRSPPLCHPEQKGQSSAPTTKALADPPPLPVPPPSSQMAPVPVPDAVADCVLASFDRLPARRKPRPRSDGVREWVPLSGIVLAKGTDNAST